MKPPLNICDRLSTEESKNKIEELLDIVPNPEQGRRFLPPTWRE